MELLSGISWAAKLDRLVAVPVLILIALVVVPVVVILVIPVVVPVIAVPVIVPVIPVVVVSVVPIVVPVISAIIPVIPVSVPAVILPVVPIIPARLDCLAGLANLAGCANLSGHDSSGRWLLVFALAPSQVQLLLKLCVRGVSDNNTASSLDLGREGDGNLHLKGSRLFGAGRPDLL